jgi:hypothetical protein
MEGFIPKIVKPAVGLNLIYSESLYLNSSEKSSELKRKFEPLAHSHKYAFQNLLEKHPSYIQPSINFSSWNQMILESKDFYRLFGELKKIYQDDKLLQKLVQIDASGNTKKEPFTENKINFILEEILMFYLASKGEIRLRNDFIQDKQKWVLWCYPGKPLLSEIYLYKKNFFNLENSQNIYENAFYDLIEKKLYDFSKIEINDLEQIASRC